MTARLRAGLTLAAGLAAVAWAAGVVRPAPAAAQPTVTVSVPLGDTLRSVTPPFTVLATGFSTLGLFRIRLQVDTSARFRGPFVVDTMVLSEASNLAIVPAKPLPPAVRVYYRATVTDAVGNTASSPITGPVIAPQWVTLVSPPDVPGQPLRTRTPRFVWHSPAVSGPAGPWVYEIRIKSPAGTRVTTNWPDTSFVPPTDLEINTPYTWSVQATLPSAPLQPYLVDSPYTFVIQDPTVEVASTALYQSFPNPFPSLLNSATCIWFDLRNASRVQLDVYDLRGLHVRRLMPNAQLGDALAAGRYGAGAAGSSQRCDPHFEWDGRDDRGNTVPEGVYLIRFRADGIVATRKVIFRGLP